MLYQKVPAILELQRHNYPIENLFLYDVKIHILVNFSPLGRIV